MKCYVCKAQLEKNDPVCPACGEDNSAALKKHKMFKIVAAAVCCLVLVVGIVTGVYFLGGFHREGSLVRGSYTVSAENAAAAMDRVIATMDGHALTNGQLQVIYWMMFYDFLDYYGSSVLYMLDYTAPLDTQYFNELDGVTWQHYFLDLAVDTWVRYTSLAADAQANGYEMSAELQTYLETTIYHEMTEAMEEYGYDSLDALVQADFGPGSSMQDYVDYLTIYYYGNEYFNHLFAETDFTDEEIEEYYNLYASDYEEAGYGKDDGYMVDVRHILVIPGDDPEANTFTDEQWEAALAEAEALLQQWREGEATAESFGVLANAHSEDPGSNTNGGLYEQVMEGSMTEAFDEWCFDETRQVGDSDIVRTNFGYHIMYFAGSSDLWYEAAKYDMTYESLNAYIADLEAEMIPEIDYWGIALGEVVFG